MRLRQAGTIAVREAGGQASRQQRVPFPSGIGGGCPSQAASTTVACGGGRPSPNPAPAVGFPRARAKAVLPDDDGGPYLKKQANNLVAIGELGHLLQTSCGDGHPLPGTLGRAGKGHAPLAAAAGPPASSASRGEGHALPLGRLPCSRQEGSRRPLPVRLLPRLPLFFLFFFFPLVPIWFQPSNTGARVDWSSH